MPKPRAYKPVLPDHAPSLESKLVPLASLESSSPAISQKTRSNLPKDSAKTRKASLPDQAEHRSQSLEKHGENLRYRAAYVANLLAEDMIRAFRYVGKKDAKLLKDLVWSFGVLVDKATGGTNTEAMTIRIPAKLLDNVKAVIAIQAEKKAAKAPKQLDAESSITPVKSMGCEPGVAVAVASPVPDATYN